jgi:hypothetical protein
LDIRTIHVPVGSDFAFLTAKVQDKLGLPGPFKIKYKDEEGSLILVTDDEDLSLGIRTGDVWEVNGVPRDQPEWDLWVSL